MNKERVKEHFKENKKLYIGVGIGLFAGITCCMMRDRHAVFQRDADGLDVATVRSLSFNFLAKESGNVTTTIVRDGRGHPGYITRWIEGMVDYETQGLAAKEHGVPPSIMSGHLKGKLPDVNGQHFERIAV